MVKILHIQIKNEHLSKIYVFSSFMRKLDRQDVETGSKNLRMILYFWSLKKEYNTANCL